MTCDDIYWVVIDRGDYTRSLIYLILVAIALQIIVKAFIFTRVLSQGKRIEAVLKRVELLVKTSEVNGEITDRNMQRTNRTLDKVEAVALTQASHIFHESQKLEVIDKNVVEIKEVVKPSDGKTPPGGTRLSEYKSKPPYGREDGGREGEEKQP